MLEGDVEMFYEWMSLLSSVIVLIAVYYAFSKNSDSAKKFILIIVIGVFLLLALNQFLDILEVALGGTNRYNLIPLVDTIVISLMIVFLLNHYKKADKILYVLMVIYFLIDLYGIYLFYQ